MCKSFLFWTQVILALSILFCVNIQRTIKITILDDFNIWCSKFIITKYDIQSKKM